MHNLEQITKITELSQEVVLFDDSDIKGIQTVSIDLKEKWVSIIHDGNSLTMSLHNWEKLQLLMAKLIK